jgi:two-component system chemotaxis response regulator CheB
MAGHDIIVVGASAGGVEALRQVVSGLPPGLPAAMFVVVHTPAELVSRLPEVLSRSGPLLATHPRDSEPFYPGHVYVAPPNRHLLLEPGRVRVTIGPRENRHRPAIDPLFRSAARVYGQRVIAVLLSGSLYDGVAGLLAIRSAGGIAVIQDPQDALINALPRSALQVAGADYVVPVAGLAPLLAELVLRPVPDAGGASMSDPLERIPDVISSDMQAQEQGKRRGEVSTFTCPECGGTLWQLDEAQLVRFSCHVGHIYNGEALLAEQSEALEAALWTAVRTFKEKAVLASQLAADCRRRGDGTGAARLEEQGHQAQRYAALIQQYVLQGGDAVAPGQSQTEVPPS